MTESSERSYEERLAQVTDWIKKIGEEGVVEEIDAEIIKGVLEGMGANTEISEDAKQSLAIYSNAGKRSGLNAVWGGEKVGAYKTWVINEFIPQYEQKTGRELHTLYDRKNNKYDDVKHSGMMQFLGELTAYAEGQIVFKEYKRLTERRVEKGREFAYGDPYKPYQPSFNAPYPPEFPLEAWNFLISSKSELSAI